MAMAGIAISRALPHSRPGRAVYRRAVLMVERAEAGAMVWLLIEGMDLARQDMAPAATPGPAPPSGLAGEAGAEPGAEPGAGSRPPGHLPTDQIEPEAPLGEILREV